MIIEFLVGALVVAVGYAAYKHYGLATIEADVKAAVTKAEASISATISASSIVATIKADLAKYL